jgi:uncharacterized membrane protein
MGRKSNKNKGRTEDAENKRNRKQAAVNSPEKSGRKIVAGIAAAAFTAAFIAVVMLSGGQRFDEVVPENGIVRLAVSDLNDGKAHYYRYNGGRAIDFFVLRSSDGVIRAAFDACDVCFREKKGYRQEGDLMVCNNCEQQFPSVKINEIKGGCNPAPLERQVQGDYLVLRAKDIEQGSFYF